MYKKVRYYSLAFGICILLLMLILTLKMPIVYMLF